MSLLVPASRTDVSTCISQGIQADLLINPDRILWHSHQAATINPPVLRAKLMHVCIRAAGVIAGSPHLFTSDCYSDLELVHQLQQLRHNQCSSLTTGTSDQYLCRQQ
jgi:hypothetical protein